MDYETGIGVAFVVWVLHVIMLLVTLNSTMARNLRLVGQRLSWISLKQEPMDADDERQTVAWKVFKFILIIGVALPLVFLSWLYVALIIGQWIYFRVRDIGAPQSVKEFRWRLKNQTLTFDQLVKETMKLTNTDPATFPQVRQEMIQSLVDRDLKRPFGATATPYVSAADTATPYATEPQPFPDVKAVSAVSATPDVQDMGEAKRLNWWAISFLVLAFAIPAIGASVGLTSAGKTGYRYGQLMMGLVVFMLVTGIYTRKRGRVSQAKARLVVGLLLAISMGTSLALEWNETKQAQQFLGDTLANRARQDQAFIALGQRFDDIDFTKAMSVEGMIDPSIIATGLDAVRRYRALMIERNELLKRNIAESTEFVTTHAPSSMSRDEALSSMNVTKDMTVKLYNALDRSQTAHMNSIEALLKWCALQQGKMTVQNGQLMFTTPLQRTQAMKLAAQLEESEKQVNEAVAGFAAFQERDRKNKAEAAQFIGK